MHSSLKTNINARLIATWAIGAILLAVIFPSVATAPILVGLPLGCLVGVLQGRAVRANSMAFARASTALEVRAALTGTATGKAALLIQWCAAVAIATLSFVRSHQLFLVGFFAGYLGFMLARESVTFSSLRHLQSISGSGSGIQPEPGSPAV